MASSGMHELEILARRFFALDREVWSTLAPDRLAQLIEIFRGVAVDAEHHTIVSCVSAVCFRCVERDTWTPAARMKGHKQSEFFHRLKTAKHEPAYVCEASAIWAKVKNGEIGPAIERTKLDARIAAYEDAAKLICSNCAEGSPAVYDEAFKTWTHKHLHCWAANIHPKIEELRKLRGS